ISTVRSRAGNVLDEDRALGIGLVGFPKRFNVAVTRAKSLMVVVGNVEMLVREDECWREWMAFLWRQRCVGGYPIGEETRKMLDGTEEGKERRMGRLERVKLHGDW